jgi:polyhydroxyalkanoate synthesis regulator phasin
MLASQTDEHVNALIEAKLAEPEMSRDEIKRYLNQLRSQTQ